MHPPVQAQFLIQLHVASRLYVEGNGIHANHSLRALIAGSRSRDLGCAQRHTVDIETGLAGASGHFDRGGHLGSPRIGSAQIDGQAAFRCWLSQLQRALCRATRRHDDAARQHQRLAAHGNGCQPRSQALGLCAQGAYPVCQASHFKTGTPLTCRNDDGAWRAQYGAVRIAQGDVQTTSRCCLRRMDGYGVWPLHTDDGRIRHQLQCGQVHHFYQGGR